MRRSEVTVLVVDDNPAHRYATVRALVKAGFKVVESWSGEDAIRHAAQADAVVLDLCLPDLDGFEVCRRLRAAGATAHLPIVHLSAVYMTDQDRLLSAKVGADLFLASPVPTELLVSTLDSLIANRKRAFSAT